MAKALQALLVNVNDDDALVQRARHGGAQPRVIDDVIEPLQHLEMKTAADVQQRKNQRNQSDHHAPSVAPQQMQESLTHGGMRHGAGAKRYT
jgi:hypothetical protein